MSAEWFVWVAHGNEHPRFIRDRRVRPVAPPSGQDRRVSPPILVAAEQFSYLKDALQAQEERVRRIARTSRLLRHILLVVAILQMGFLLATRGLAEDHRFTISWLGVDVSPTRDQLAGLLPIAAAYAVLLIVRTSATHQRYKDECHLLDLALEKFGCPTLYGLARKYRSACASTRSPVEIHRERTLVRIAENAYPAVVYVIGLWVVLGAWANAIPAYYKLTQEETWWIGWALFLYVGLLLVAAVLAASASFVLRPVKRRVIALAMQRMLTDPALPIPDDYPQPGKTWADKLLVTMSLRRMLATLTGRIKGRP